MMTSTCPSCGNLVSPAAKFCRNCGYSLQPSASLPSPPLSPVAPVPTRRRLSRVTLVVVAGIVMLLVALVACILSIKVAQKVALIKNTTTTLSEAPLSTQEVLGVETEVLVAATEPVIKIEVPSLAPEATTNILPADQYDIVVAGGGEHPEGELSYSTPYTCIGGCGSYNGTLELRGIRIVDQGFTLDLNIRIQEVSGDPWLFEADLGGMTLEINGQTFIPKASNFPTQVTSPGLMSGDLSFYDEIPLSADGQYKVTLAISNRMQQPVEGWLQPVQ